MAPGSNGGFLSLLVMALCVLSMAGCQKDQDLSVGPDGPSPGPNEPQSIIAGDAQGMEITSFDTVFFNSDFFGATGAFPMDLDANGTVDLRVMIKTWHSLGTGSHSTMWLERMNNSLLFDGYFETDTVFGRMDSTLQYDADMDPPYFLSLTDVTGCGLTGNVTPLEVYENVFRPRLYEQDATMDTTSYADVDSVFITRAPDLYNDPVHQYPNDSTSSLTRHEHLNNCFVPPLHVPQYLGFAIWSDGTLRKGWLGFELQGHHIIALTVAAMGSE